MKPQTLPSQNGAVSPSDRSQPVELWLQTSVRTFFGNFNWEDNPPEVQQIKLTTLQASATPLSLSLSVRQFFAAFDWDGATIAAATPPVPPPKVTIDVTVDDFFSQF